MSGVASGVVASAGGGSHVVLIVIGALLVARITWRALRVQRRPSSPAPSGETSTTGSSTLSVPISHGAESAMRPTRDSDATPILEIDHLTVTYRSLLAVDDVGLTIGHGEIFGLLGPNGAGKTTTLSAIEGLVRPQTGSVLVDGIDVRRHPTQARSKLGIQLQATSFQSELTIAQIVRLYAGLYAVTMSDADITDILGSIGLAGAAHRPFKQLSGGQQQRLALSIALLHRPMLLLLDEPTTGLDPQARRHLWSRIEHVRDDGGSILLTTHSMEEAQAVCTRVAIIDHGRILAIDAPRALIDQHRDDPRALAAAHGDLTLEDVFIALTGTDVRD